MLKLYHVHTMDFSISRVYLEMMQFLIGCRNTPVTITTSYYGPFQDRIQTDDRLSLLNVDIKSTLPKTTPY